MRRLLLVFALLCVLPTVVLAQYTISEKADVGAKVDSVSVRVSNDLRLDIKTPAYYRYMKRKKLLDRNYFTTKNTLLVTQYAYDNWSGGGENNFNGRFATQTQHVYHIDKLAVDTYFNASYGLGQSDKKIIKIDDVFQINSDVSYVLYKRWNYTFGINLASQFSKTYNDPKKKENYKSRFFAPANLKPYFGFTYKVSDDKKITIAPVSGNILMVFDDSLSQKGAFGVDVGRKSKLSVGSYINAQWKQNITKDGMLTYKAIVQSFWDYKNCPNLNWESWIDFKVFKLFSINLYLRFVYDDKIDIKTEDGTLSGSHLQFKESLGFGITYEFKNKSKPSYKIIK